MLALLVVLTLLASSVAVTASQAVSEAQANLDQFDRELEAVSTRDTLLFMLSTQPRTLAGLTVDDAKAQASRIPADEDLDGVAVMPVGNEIKLDGTAYAGLGDIVFSLQDDRGLISPNWSPPALINGFYSSLKVPPDQWNALDAKRLDYQDPDDLHRLNGAEKLHYQQAKMPIPINRAVTTPLEFRRILGWNGMLESVDDSDLVGTLTTGRSVAINLNTAPASVLALIPGLDVDQAARLAALRNEVPFTSVRQVEQTFPISPVASEFLTLFSSQSGNLTLWGRHFGVKRLIHWTLTPFNDGGPPWRLDYEVTLPRGNESDPAVAEPPETPLFAQPDPAGK
ncbi:type II secretion system protein GspK [Aerolutibacter ruishenii]|uniref:type II secretion system protein GspK n=1 Tax=Aerolutibacter ruishenii TaxID=686800 RepID=UPI0011A211C1|nr:type II secretion system protein GspK [Lysobacter ruishenii]